MSTTQTHLMTAEEFMYLDDYSHRHELIKGELLTMPLPKRPHGRICANLIIILGQYAKSNQRGEVYAETGYHIERDPDTVLGPDVSFIARDRTGEPEDSFYPGPPDLAVEVISPGDRRGQIERKLSLWLQAGTRSIWLVNPRMRTVEVISSIDERRLLNETDELVDDTVPGFRVKVSEIFA
jgi:Uma2 family endonuclease